MSSSKSNAKTWVLAVAVLVAAAAGLYRFTHLPQPEKPAVAPSPEAAPREVRAVRIGDVGGGPVAPRVGAHAAEPAKAAEPGDKTATVVLTPGDTVATVNGVAVHAS